jgi:hypothetical protein
LKNKYTPCSNKSTACAASQLPDWHKAAYQEICNNGTFQELEEQVHALLKQELGMRGIPIAGSPQ